MTASLVRGQRVEVYIGPQRLVGVVKSLGNATGPLVVVVDVGSWVSPVAEPLAVLEALHSARGHPESAHALAAIRSHIAALEAELIEIRNGG